MAPENFEFEFQSVEKCVLCGSPEKQEHFSAKTDGGAAARLVKCAECGLVYIDPAPTPASLAEFYGAVYLTPGYRAFDGASIPDPRQELLATFQVMEQHVDEIEEYRQPPGRLLDVGCSHGAFLLEAVSRGWTAEGVEPFEDAARFCSETLGLKVTQGEFPEAAPQGDPFDVITMYEVIEHVSAPVAVAAHAARIAAPGAILVLTSPNAESPAALVHRENWVGLKFPTHLQFFNTFTMRRLLLSTGWTPLKIRSGGSYPGQLIAFARKTRTAPAANP